MLTIIRKTTFLVFATSLSKLLPLLIGYFITLQSGQTNYATFVSFLLFAGVLTNFSSLGCCPQVLSIDGHSEKGAALFSHLILLGLISVFFVTAVVFFFINLNLINISNEFSNYIHFSIFYSIGMFFIYITTARLNSLDKHDCASSIWLLYALILFFCSLIWYFFHLEEKIMFIFMVSSSLISGMFGFFLVSKASESSLFAVYDFNLMISMVKKGIQLSLFGLLIVGLFFYLQVSLASIDESEGAAFSFFYQFFSLIIFIPSVMGNIVVPALVKGSRGKSVFFIFYFLFSVFLSSLFYIFYPYIANFYDLSNMGRSSDLIAFCMFCITAATNSYLSQIFVAKKEYSWMLFFSFLWVIFIMTYLFIDGMNLGSILRAFFYAYLMVFLCSFLLIKKRKYL